MKRLLLVWLSAFVLCATIFVFSSCESDKDDVAFVLANKTDKPVGFEIGLKSFEPLQEIPVGGQAQLLPRYFYMDISLGTEKKKVYGKQPYKLTMPTELQLVQFYYGDSVYIAANIIDPAYSVFSMDSWLTDKVLPGGIVENHSMFDRPLVFSIDEAYLSSLPRFALTDSTEAASYVKRLVGSVD